LTLAYIVAGCKDKNSFYVDGVIEGEAGKYIYINRVDVNTPVLIDSSKINQKGAFRFRVSASETNFYQLGFSSANFITLLTEPGEKINLLFRSKNIFENYSVNGSQGSSKLQILDVTLAETKRKLDSLTAIYTKASKEPGFDLNGPSIQAEYTDLIRKQRKKNIEFIINNINSMASIKALYQKITPDTYVLYEPTDLQYLKIVTLLSLMLLICTLSLSKCSNLKSVFLSESLFLISTESSISFPFKAFLSLLPKDQISEIVLPSNPVSILLTPERFLARFMQLVRLKKQQFDLG